MGKRIRFGTWDIDDERKVNYTFRDSKTNKTYYFTSEDSCSYGMKERLKYAWIENIKLIKNEFNNPEGEWYVTLYED
jgi:hypothetical protein